MVLEGGDMISADLRIIAAANLQADESTLTGESLPVARQAETLHAAGRWRRRTGGKPADGRDEQCASGECAECPQRTTTASESRGLGVRSVVAAG